MSSGRAVCMLSIGVAALAAGCSSTRETVDDRRSLINSQASVQQFDRHVREFWSQGMTRDQVELAAMDARVEVRPTQDARALREIDPEYAGRPALVAKVGPPGIFIDVKYFKAHEQVGWLYFFFDDKDRLSKAVYRLSNEQQAEAKTATRVIIPQGGGT